ncbi:hypothetical protein ANCCAN_07874 [Ancylostoma caninum]|uniref:C-type lectin domain-containing protein n=1 Tax=Ancylostoma caninum TaxID=29170 RepID=A0A368GP14_ANCCA|nr:hypothetical protein ANCCAN_07874 [Ancylostoma caninum]
MISRSMYLLALIIPAIAFPLEQDGSGDPARCVCPPLADPVPSSTAAPQMCVCPVLDEPSTTTSTAAPELCVCPPAEEPTTTEAPKMCVCPALEEPSTTTAAPELCVCPTPEEPTTTEAPKLCVCPAQEEPSTTPEPCVCPPMEEPTTTAAPCVCPAQEEPTTTPAPCVCPVVEETTPAPVCECPVYEESTTTTAAPPPPPARPPCCCCVGRRSKCGCGCGGGCNGGCGRPAQAEQPRPSGDMLVCPDGWIRYQQSCYYMEMAKMDMQSAERACNEKGGSLFVADSIGEFNEVMKESPLYFWSWIGLGQNEAGGLPRWHAQSGPSSFKCLPADYSNLVWDGAYGMNPAELKWLVTPFNSYSNGWSTAATCVAHYNIDTYASTYLYFYPCSYQFHSICERNYTLLNL